MIQILGVSVLVIIFVKKRKNKVEKKTYKMDQIDNIKNVLIACTGSVATIKLAEMVHLFLSSSKPAFRIKIIATERAKHFFDGADIPENVPVLTDADEWQAWQGRGDPVLHIDLTKWADVMVIAPMDANTLAKTANVRFRL